MSIALDSSGGGGRGRIERSGFISGTPYISTYGPPDPIDQMFSEDRRFPPANRVVRGKRREEESDSSSSSSIGRNSDLSAKSSDGDDSGENEVQSSYKGPLDSMDALEDVLPGNKGISKFYCGKSKSFTSLADASSISSIKELAKPENLYARKRKNLLASNRYREKNHCYSSRNNGGGLSKRPANSSRSTLNLAMIMSSAESSYSSESLNSNSSSPARNLPPLHPQTKRSANNGSGSSSPEQQNLYPWRSFSLSDLQCVAAPNPLVGDSESSSRDKENPYSISIRLSSLTQNLGVRLENGNDFGLGANLEFYNSPSNDFQAKLVLKPLAPERRWKFIFEPIHQDVRLLSKKIPVTKFLNLQVGIGHSFLLHATGWKWKLTTSWGGDGISRIRNKTSIGLCPGMDLRFGWRADYVLPEITGAVGTGEPLFNMNSGSLQASLDRVEAIFTHRNE
ncbi:hypothetical protein Nepgr_018421 [Nepenthes gracilis]|uniref:DUF7781 domain-containing protein n=1 Tax=Nepenthes gracilis TaxID=150966 RepID=A0AAD3SRC1_NEPGR|nr:hypothetical protein Nepgr_018421 [Nepenthes gracilis]